MTIREQMGREPLVCPAEHEGSHRLYLEHDEEGEDILECVGCGERYQPWENELWTLYEELNREADIEHEIMVWYRENGKG